MRRWVSALFAISLLFFVYLLFAPGLLFRSHQLASRQNELKDEVVQLQHEIASLKDEIRLLSGHGEASRKYLKKLARDELVLIEPGEHLFLFRDANQ